MSNSNTLMREEKNTYLGKTILSTPEAIQFLGISGSLLDKLCSNGVLPYSNGTDVEGKVRGRLRFFRVDDLINWMTSYQSTTVSIDNYNDSVRKVS